MLPDLQAMHAISIPRVVELQLRTRKRIVSPAGYQAAGEVNTPAGARFDMHVAFVLDGDPYTIAADGSDLRAMPLPCPVWAGLRLMPLPIGCSVPVRQGFRC